MNDKAWMIFFFGAFFGLFFFLFFFYINSFFLSFGCTFFFFNKEKFGSQKPRQRLIGGSM